jgi:hypothetical protein
MSRMTLDAALQLFPDDVRAEIRTRLAAYAPLSGRLRDAVASIELESRLPFEAWQQLVEALYRTIDEDSFVDEFVLVFRRYQLIGGPTAFKPARLGRAISAERFISYLTAFGYSYSASQQTATEILGVSVVDLNATAEYVPWKPGRPVWATFDRDGGVAPVFPHGISAKYLVGVLGLDPNDSDPPLLLFEYALPDSVKALYPTIADAYSSELWQVFFRPVSPGAPHGATMTSREYLDEPTWPEAVHAGFPGGTFLTPVRPLP